MNSGILSSFLAAYSVSMCFISLCVLPDPDQPELNLNFGGCRFAPDYFKSNKNPAQSMHIYSGDPKRRWISLIIGTTMPA